MKVNMHAEESTTSVSVPFFIINAQSRQNQHFDQKKLAQILKPPSGRLEGPNWKAWGPAWGARELSSICSGRGGRRKEEREREGGGGGGEMDGCEVNQFKVASLTSEVKYLSIMV